MAPCLLTFNPKVGGALMKIKNPLLKKIWYYKSYYLMFLPVFVLLLLLKYLPMLGIRWSFYDYRPVGTPTFVGWKHFEALFSRQAFWQAFGNTLTLSIGNVLLNTFMSVILSIFLNEMLQLGAKKFFQTVLYLPHFMSWVVAASVFELILSPSYSGMINGMLREAGLVGERGIYFMSSPDWWRPIYFIANIWKNTGWGTIIFLATLSSINPESYEAADIDGASRIQKMRYITLPGLTNTILTVLILNLAKIMNIFESVFVMMNDGVTRVAEVIQTYIYHQTFGAGTANYGYTTAVGLFRSLIGCILVLFCNFLSKKIRGRGII
jgi:putative aldouronate transport system permease protein